jgi:hypothetical protein
MISLKFSPNRVIERITKQNLKITQDIFFQNATNDNFWGVFDHQILKFIIKL